MVAPPLLLGYFLFRRATRGVPEHIRFGEHQRIGCLVHFKGLPLQETTAQQREFLHRDAMLAN
jgi:hypothetical protein